MPSDTPNSGIKVALTGNAALELLADCFRRDGYDVCPPDVPLDKFKPDFVYDVTSHDDVLARETPGFFDDRMKELAGSPYSLDGMRAIVEEFKWETLRSPRKLLAVDADNTLWRGVLSEDGPDALEPYAEFQNGLKQLRDDGVVLVLLSKNNPFELDWFTACKANWEPKPENLLAVCRELNLTPDAAVFIDDDPCERAMMSARLPEVAVAPFPADMANPRQFLRRLKEYFFADAGRTFEDRLRAADYARQMRAPRPCDAGKDSYLDDLGLWVKPRLSTLDDLDRLAQMAGKTNQFNATTIRRTREDFAKLIEDDGKRIFTFRAGDRFGEQGLVCYIVADLQSRRITDFVMRCRAMGRTLDHFAYGHVKNVLGYAPAIDFVPTAKNAPFAKFMNEISENHATPLRRWKIIAEPKRITLFAGHYGSGKTNIALNYAKLLRRDRYDVAVADLDIVNPYFRTKDAAPELERDGIRLVVSDFANSNVDFPALPKEMYSLIASPDGGGTAPRIVVDVGGDDRGALALGRYVDDIRAGGDYEMLAVVNASRPLTRTPADTVEVLREIEAACAIPFTGIVNNTNLGRRTTEEVVLESMPYAKAIAEAMGVPVRFTCAAAPIAAQLSGRVQDILPLDIMQLYYMTD